MKKLHFSQLAKGGFAGLKERQFVMDKRVFGTRKGSNTFNGLGHFVYLADANFMPKGETGLHPHKEIDVISIMVNGRISHAGSLEHGQEIEAGYSQVQRAGGQGFLHNEINPDDTENQMIQMWVLPDEYGEAAGYQVFEPETGRLQQIYGGKKGQTSRFYSNTSISVANLNKGDSINHEGNSQLYLSKGAGALNGELIEFRTLVEINSGFKFEATEDSQVILVYLTAVD